MWGRRHVLGCVAGSPDLFAAENWGEMLEVADFTGNIQGQASASLLSCTVPTILPVEFANFDIVENATVTCEHLQLEFPPPAKGRKPGKQ